MSRIAGPSPDRSPQRASYACIASFVLAACLAAEPAATPHDLDRAARSLDAGICEEARAAVDAALADPATTGCARAEWERLLGRSLRACGESRSPEALDAAVRAVADADGACGADSRAAAEARLELGILRLVRGETDAGRAALEEALATTARLGDDGRALAAEAHVYLGQAALDAGDHARAAEEFARARELQTAALDPEDPRIAYRLTREANLAHAERRDDDAVVLGERALAIYRARYGATHPRVAMALHNLGVYHEARRDLPEAARVLEEALAIRAARGESGAGNAGTTRMLLANVCEDLGDDERARALRVEAVAALDRQGDARDEVLCVPLLGLARMEVRLGDLAAARQSVARLCALLSDAPPAFATQRAQTLDLSARIAQAEGRGPDAIRDWTEALESLRAAGLEDAPDAASMLRALGFERVKAGVAAGDLAEVRAGRAQCELAHAAAVKQLPSGHPDLAWSLATLARAAVAAHEPDDAFRLALEAASMARAHVASTAARLGERDALGFAADRTPGLPLALLLAARKPEARAAAAWDELSRARGVVFDEMRVRRAFARESVDAESVALVRRVAEARGRLARQRAVLRPGAAVDAASRAQLRAEEQACAALERELAARCAAWRATRAVRTAGYDEVARALPRGSALVAYARLAEHDAYVALVLGGPGAAPAAFDLGSAVEIDQLVAAARAECRGPGRLADWIAAATPLRQRVWDPVAASVAGAEQVLIVPDGALLAIDFAALPLGPEEFLIERGPTIHVLQTERDVLGASPARARGSVVVVADPAGADGLGGVDGFPELPSARREAFEVADGWRACDGRDDLSRALVGAEATEPALRSAAQSAWILHVATHAFASVLARATAAGERGLGSVVSGPAAVEPFRVGLSREHVGGAALVLARGAPTEGGLDPSSDGLLTDEEIVDLDLEGLELAVLAACDTGTGEVQSLEGVFGLRRAFRLAGARAVVTSLWPVPDATARERMVRFHELLCGGAPTAASALRDAERELLQRLRAAELETHPWSWAGFVVAGEPARFR